MQQEFRAEVYSLSSSLQTEFGRMQQRRSERAAGALLLCVQSGGYLYTRCVGGSFNLSDISSHKCNQPSGEPRAVMSSTAHKRLTWPYI